MPDLHDSLENEARRVRSEPGALGEVLERAGRRRRTKLIATGALALVVAGAGFGLAYAAFRPARQVEPGGLPVPGPSVSASAPTYTTTVTNASRTEGAAEFAAAVLGAEGIPPEVVDLSGPLTRSDTTRIFCHPRLEDIALTLRDQVFPGAELRPRIDPDSLVIAVGDDFVRDNAALFESFATIRSFMTRRAEGSGAETFLSVAAARQYANGVGGLSLYGYAEEARFSITAISPGDGSAVASVTIGDREEQLTLDGEILAAELVSPPAPEFEQVLAFVRSFLNARREASGAGTYLGEEAREAYASHEDGLDLLRYAADEDLREARIVRYDKISPDRYRVVVRFSVEAPNGPLTRTHEALFVEPLESAFVVADAERWHPG